LARPLTITIDGPAASGKSTIGKMLADWLGYVYLDTGAMYRAVTWAALDQDILIEDEPGVAALAERLRIEVLRPGVDDGRAYTVLADGQDITWQIRQPEVDMGVSPVSAYAGVRAALTDQQRGLARQGEIVMVGRDIGTVVLPDADLKLYLDASLDERVRRRYQEVLDRGEQVDYGTILDSVRGRDEIDSNRNLAPLRAAEDAHCIDTTGLNVHQVFERVMDLVLGWHAGE
jgi:cytidylate kinase